MKKLMVALFVLGLVAAFGSPAFALDVKFSGSYYAAGVFESNHSLANDAYRETGALAARYRASSAAFVQQRLRLQPEFKIADGLTLVTRFDAVEKKWGDNRTFTGSNNYDNTNRTWDYDDVARGAVRAQENIEFERAYVDFNTAIGRFQVGYINTLAFGTDFLNSAWSKGGVRWQYPIGSFTLMAMWEHGYEGGSGGNGGTNPSFAYANADRDIYSIGADYRWKGGSAGLQLQNWAHSDTDYSLGSTTATPFPTKGSVQRLYTINPYAKASFGPLYLEGEFWYGIGDWIDYRDTRADVDLDAMALYLNARYDMGPFYAGALMSWVTGDDPGTRDKMEGSVLNALWLGKNFDVFLLMFNDFMSTVSGSWNGYNSTSIGTFEDNALIWQLYAGWKATPNFDVKVSYGMATADRTAVGVDDDYGSEFDIAANYKIYNNLTYMVGFGYWWAGDYFKGTGTTNEVKSDYVVLHKLTLSF